MRLLFVLENYWPLVGGVENAFQRLCEGAVERGHRVTVVTHRAPETTAYEYLNGVEIVRVSSFRSRYLFTFAAILEAYRRAKRCDVIQTTTFNAAPAAWLAGILARKPVVLTVNETWIGKWRSYTNFSRMKCALHDALERIIFALPYENYVAISAATARRLNEVVVRSRGRTETIYYGFDRDRWCVPTNVAATRRALGLRDEFVILAYGRVGTSKGFDVLIDAFPRIRSSVRNARLVLILSSGVQYVNELGALKRRAGPGVRFVAPVSYNALPSYIRAADCVAVPSLVEGFGYTTLETVAAGVPVVASDTGSIPEVIGGRYRLVRPRDADALADAVIAISKGCFTTGPERTFAWSDTLERYESAYRRILSREPPVEVA